MKTYKVQFNMTNGQSENAFAMVNGKMVVEFEELSEAVELFNRTSIEQCSERDCEAVELVKLIDGEVEEWEENEVPELSEFNTGWIVKNS